MTLANVLLERDFNSNHYNMWVDGEMVEEDSPLSATNVLAILSDRGIIEYHEVEMIKPDPEPEPEYCGECGCLIDTDEDRRAFDTQGMCETCTDAWLEEDDSDEAIDARFQGCNDCGLDPCECWLYEEDDNMPDWKYNNFN
jgi:hypothetical protein